MNEFELNSEILKLENAIRKHRDIFDRERTLEDDKELYNILQDKKVEDFTLPPRDEFLGDVKINAGCPNFWKSHQMCNQNDHDIHSWGPCE